MLEGVSTRSCCWRRAHKEERGHVGEVQGAVAPDDRHDALELDLWGQPRSMGAGGLAADVDDVDACLHHLSRMLHRCLHLQLRQ